MSAFLIWLVRLLILLLIIRLLMRGLSSMRQMGSRTPPRVPERAGGTLVRDPQCGTYIPESSALAVGSGPNAMHFCSPACRDAWAAAHGHARVKA
jgi:hypothetical protein